MPTFTRNYSALGGPLTFDVVTNFPSGFVNLNGTLTTVVAEIGVSYLLTDNFSITGTNFADTITTAGGKLRQTRQSAS